MPVTRTLKRNPSIADVAQARSTFEAVYGPADLVYRGQVYDKYDGTYYNFVRPLVVGALYPMQQAFVLSLFDGYVAWQVEPVEPYRFDIIARDNRPARKLHLSADLPKWATAFQPYAEAAQLIDLDAMLKALDFRNPVNAPTEGSIAASFRSKARRCGIYVLHFANSEYYVGQTVDITKRFAQHRKRHQDIVRVSFRPVGRRYLNFHEAQVIRLMETKRFRLRNINMTSILATEPGAFDELMSVERQQRWLADPSYVDLGDTRIDTHGSDALYNQRYARLKAMEQYDELFAVVQAYVYAALPGVMSGEAHYWQASVLPSSNPALVRINVNWQEVFFANINDQGLFFYCVVSRRELQRAFGDNLGGLSARYPDLELDAANYRAGGSDQIAVWLWNAPTAVRFVSDRDVIPALRHYNLRLIKKGKCPWARSHNFDLVTDILSAVAAPVPPIASVSI